MAVEITKTVIDGDSTGAERALKRVSNGMKTLNNDVTDFSKKTGIAAATIAKFATAGAALATIAIGSKAVKDTADFADEMVKAAQKVGTTTEALSGLRHAADLSDVSFDQLQTGMAKLAKTASDFERGLTTAQDAFNDLGIDPTKFKDTTDLFEAVADELAKLPDGAKKTALAMEILGKSGAQLIPLLNGGAEGIRKLRQEAEDLGIVVSTETAKQAEEFNDSLTRLQSAATGLKFQLGKFLLPALTDIAKASADAAKQGGILNGIWVALGATMAHILGLDEASKAKKQLQDVNDQINLITKQIATGKLNPDGINNSFVDFIFPANNLNEQTKRDFQKRLDVLQKERDLLVERMNQTSAADKQRVTEMQRFSELSAEAKESELKRLQSVFEAQKKGLAAAEKDVEAAAKKRESIIKEFKKLQEDLAKPSAEQGRVIESFEVEKAIEEVRKAQALAANAPASEADRLSDEALQKARDAFKLLEDYKSQEQESGSSIDANASQQLVERLGADLTGIATQIASTQEQAAKDQVELLQKSIQDTLNQAEALKQLEIGFDQDSAKKSLQDLIEIMRQQAQNNPIQIPATIVSGSLPKNVSDAVEGKAAGGPIFGPGQKGRDSRLIMAAPGEHMLTAREVDAAGGHAAIYRIRRALLNGQLRGYAGGGAIGNIRPPTITPSPQRSLQPIDLTIPGIGRYRVETSQETAAALQSQLAMESLKYGSIK